MKLKLPPDRDWIRQRISRITIPVVAALVSNLFILDPIQAATHVPSNITVAQLSESLSVINSESILAQALWARIGDGNSPARANAEKKLALVNRRLDVAKKVFVSGIRRSLHANSGSLALLKEYAAAFSQLNIAQNALFDGLMMLKADRAEELKIQNALAAVLGGGQSDMNSELGANREKLRLLALRVPEDLQVIDFAKNELSFAQSILNEAEARALADPLASLALTGQMHYLITLDANKTDMSKPINWFWGILKS